jgi:hypothetical protein
MFTPETGTWYIVVTCSNCKRTIFLFPDLNKGKGRLDANYIVTCPECNHKGSYTAQHYHHREQTDAKPSGELAV